MKRLLVGILLILSLAIYGRKNFVLISAPGSGKGTFFQYLVENYGYIQICPGDIFRNEIRAQTELGKKIQPIVNRGEYIDERIVCKLIADGILSALKQKKGFIIDGFPRSTYSFDFLYRFLRDNDLINEVIFIQFIASDEQCVERISERSFCPDCCKVYNASFAQSKIENICDDCGIRLTVREADTIEIVQKRLHYFHEHIEPLMEQAQSMYEIKRIDTSCSIQDLKMQYDLLIN